MALFGRPTQQDEERAIAYRDWLVAQHPLAIASFVLGVFSFIEFGALVFPGVAGIILGVVALRKLSHQRGVVDEERSSSPASSEPVNLRISGHRFAWMAGIILGVVALRKLSHQR